jgi:hypothetical protein
MSRELVRIWEFRPRSVDSATAPRSPQRQAHDSCLVPTLAHSCPLSPIISSGERGHIPSRGIPCQYLAGEGPMGSTTVADKHCVVRDARPVPGVASLRRKLRCVHRAAKGRCKIQSEALTDKEETPSVRMRNLRIQECSHHKGPLHLTPQISSLLTSMRVCALGLTSDGEVQKRQ